MFVLALLYISCGEFFGKNIKSSSIGIIASILTIINVFSIELFLYIEKGIMALSVLLNILAIEKLIECFEGKKKSFIFVLIYMFIANCCYQGTVAIFIAIASIYIIKYSKNFKDFVKNNFIALMGYGIPAVINYVIVKFIFADSRIAGQFDLTLSIKKIGEGSIKLLQTYSIVPKYLFVCIIGILLLTAIYCIMCKNSKIIKKVVDVLAIFYVILVSFMVTVLPQLMQATASIWFVPRSSYAFGGILGILIAYIFMNYKINIRLEKILITTMIFYLIIQYINFQTIIRDHYIVNYMDEVQALQIREKINKYEEETGNVITKVAFYQNDTPSYTYPGIIAIGDINIKALSPDWARIPFLKHYLNRTLEIVDIQEEIYKQYFENKNWNHYEEEQLIFIGDTMHMYIY